MEEAKDKKQDAGSPVMCKRCGRAAALDPIAASDEDVKEYFRCMLGGRTFSKTIKVEGGRVQITCVAPSAAVQQITENMLGMINPQLLTDLQVMSLIKSIEVTDPEAGTTKTLFEIADDEERIDIIKTKYAETLDTLYKKIPDIVMLAVIRRAVAAFSLLLSGIIEKVTSADFYAGIGLH